MMRPRTCARVGIAAATLALAMTFAVPHVAYATEGMPTPAADLSPVPDTSLDVTGTDEAGKAGVLPSDEVNPPATDDAGEAGPASPEVTAKGDDATPVGTDPSVADGGAPAGNASSDDGGKGAVPPTAEVDPTPVDGTSTDGGATVASGTSAPLSADGPSSGADVAVDASKADKSAAAAQAASGADPVPVATSSIVAKRASEATPAPAAKVTTAAKSATVAKATAVAQVKPADAPKVTYSNMYRLYNPNSGEHFYTGSLFEARSVAEAGWRWEAVGWVAPNSGNPVYRLYNPFAGDHHFTLSAYERDHLIAAGWRYEGIAWYSDASSASLSVLRQYNPNAVSGTHNFTTSVGEDAHLRSVGWIGEGVAWRASNQKKLAIKGFWLVTSAWGALERYWVGADALIAISRLVQVSEGSGWNAYATSSGAVVRGVHDRGDGWAWIADNEGRLATGNGWVVTGTYDSGRMRRYWFSSHGSYALTRLGWFDQDGATYYAEPAHGYVTCSTCILRDSGWYWADADGKITRIESGKIGYQNPNGFYQVSAYNVQLPSYAHGYFTYVTPSRIRPDASREDCIEAFVRRAMEYVGTPYRWNYAMAPGDGVDCVGLIMQCAYAVGMNLGEFNPFDHMASGDDGWHSHDANNLWDYGNALHVGLGERRRGDVISWSGHVAVYLGDDTIIEAARPGTEVWYSSMWSNGTPRGVIRLFQ